MKSIDLTGRRFGKLLVTSLSSEIRQGCKVYHTICDCGNDQYSTIGHWLSRGLIVKCDQCRTLRVGDITWNWFSSHVLRRCRAVGYVKAQEVTITMEYVWELFLKQDKKCALTRLPLNHPNKTYSEKMKSGNASLDRIDSTKGYIPGNVQWVHKDINRMKNKYAQKDFIAMCRLVAKHNKS